MCPVKQHHPEFFGSQKSVVKGIMWSDDTQINRKLKDALLASDTWNVDKQIVTMVLQEGVLCEREINKLKQVEEIRKLNLSQKIFVPELIFNTYCQSSIIIKHAVGLSGMTNMLLRNQKVCIMYCSDVGQSFDRIQENGNTSLSNISVDDLYTAISGLIRTYKKISNQGVLHRDIRPSNVTYKKDKDKVSFISLILVGPITMTKIWMKLMSTCIVQFSKICVTTFRSNNIFSTSLHIFLLIRYCFQIYSLILHCESYSTQKESMLNVLSIHIERILRTF